MSTFKGFNVTGIDPNQYPVFTDDNDMRYDLFYLTLESIGANPDYENQRLWDYCFRHEIENWNNAEWAAIPKLKFIFNADGDAFISASGEPLKTLESYLSQIKELVGSVNDRFMREADSVSHFRETIKQINASYSRN